MVKITNLSENPDLVLTNDKKFMSKNIGHCKMSVILNYSQGCGACRQFHPIYMKYVSDVYSTQDKKLQIAEFFEISSDNGQQQTLDAVNVLVNKCNPEHQNYIPLLMVFCGTKLIESHVGSFLTDDDYKSIEQKVSKYSESQQMKVRSELISKYEMKKLHEFINKCQKKCNSQCKI